MIHDSNRFVVFCTFKSPGLKKNLTAEFLCSSEYKYSFFGCPSFKFVYGLGRFPQVVDYSRITILVFQYSRVFQYSSIFFFPHPSILASSQKFSIFLEFFKIFKIRHPNILQYSSSIQLGIQVASVLCMSYASRIYCILEGS